MFANPIRRRRTLASAAGAVALISVLAGCTGQTEPGSYGDKVESNFVKQCVATFEVDKVGDAQDFCQCAYDAISDEETGMEFSEFKKVNNDLRDENGPLPESFTKYYDACERPQG